MFIKKSTFTFILSITTLFVLVSLLYLNGENQTAESMGVEIPHPFVQVFNIHNAVIPVILEFISISGIIMTIIFSSKEEKIRGCR